MQKKNPATGVVISPLGYGGNWQRNIDQLVARAKQTEVGSKSRQQAAEVFVREALNSLGCCVAPQGATDGISSIALNTWVVPYLQNAVAVLTGSEDEYLDW
jgi:hypothetical protein